MSKFSTDVENVGKTVQQFANENTALDQVSNGTIGLVGTTLTTFAAALAAFAQRKRRKEAEQAIREIHENENSPAAESQVKSRVGIKAVLRATHDD